MVVARARKGTAVRNIWNNLKYYNYYNKVIPRAELLSINCSTVVFIEVADQFQPDWRRLNRT